MFKYSSKVLVVVMLVVSMLSTLYVPAMAADSDIVTFADATLEKAVRDNIGKATGDILQSDVSSIRAIMLEVERVSSLQGIQALTSLGSLKITDSQLSDLSPLAGLPIYWVDFSNCQISNISVLSGFSGLEFAYLKNNKISDVSPLMGLTKLAEVELTGNPVSEASVRAIPSGSIKFVAAVVATPEPTATPVPVVVTPEPTQVPVVTVAPTATPVIVTPEPTATPVVTVAPTATPVPVVVTPEPTQAPVATSTPVVEVTTPAAVVVEAAALDTMTLDAVADKTSISLTWNTSKSKKLLGYNVYRNDGIETIQLTDFPIEETSYVDEKVLPGVEYTYAVESVYSKKETSDKSKEVKAKLTSETVIALQVDNSDVKVNGSSAKIDEQGSAPVVVDGRTILPIRTIIEKLGGTITWKGESKLVTINFRGTIIELTIDNNTAMVNGETKTLDVPAMIRSNRTYIPLRFVAENLGCSIKWDPATKGIVISY